MRADVEYGRQTLDLEREFAALLERTIALESANAMALERGHVLERENKILREQLVLMRQHLFGRRSERLEPGQLGLLSAEVLAQRAEAASTPSVRSVPRTQQLAGHGRASFAAHLPREVIEFRVPDESRTCTDCGKAIAPDGAHGPPPSMPKVLPRRFRDTVKVDGSPYIMES